MVVILHPEPAQILSRSSIAGRALGEGSRYQDRFIREERRTIQYTPDSHGVALPSTCGCTVDKAQGSAVVAIVGCVPLQTRAGRRVSRFFGPTQGTPAAANYGTPGDEAMPGNPVIRSFVLPFSPPSSRRAWDKRRQP